MISIPSVDLRAGRTDHAAFAEQLGMSLERFGFAIVADHGIDDALITRAEQSARAFFALPDAVKRAYHDPSGGGQRGYTPFGVEAAKGATEVDLKEFWHVGRTLPAGHRNAGIMANNVWPAEIADFEAHTRALYDALDAMALELMGAIALHLGLALDFFEAPMRDGNSILRLLHYPPMIQDAKGLRAEAHEDINAITLLLGAEEPGLQLLDRDGRWLDIAPPPGALVVNIGDMLQRLTNNRLPSTTHRVINPAPERSKFARYSMPFFAHFAPDFTIETLPQCIGPDRNNLYPTPIAAQDYLQERLREIRLA